MEELAGRSGHEARRLGSERARAARDPILTTKMNPPVLRSDIVARPRLVERLERDVRRPLTLISAPAGYGKSTLAAQWLESSSLAGVWLSLDDGDNDLRSFLSYFVAATRRHSAEACRATHEILGAAELPAPAALANLLANELETLRRPFVLALDDYHRITNPAIHELLDQVLRHPPRSLHLAIVTRHDPPLRLTAMRAGGLAIEIREADLRFSAEETAAVFRDVASVALDTDSLAKVVGDLEGWIVGLRLVCLALYNLRDPKAYLSGLRGHLAQIQQYLVEQVLSRQSPELQRCLLRTSILDRFCAPLCEALCAEEVGQDSARPRISGRDFLRAASESNLFTVDLDGRGEWLRYHHLFQQVLRHLLESRAGATEVRALHRRASRWLETQGFIDEALDHALAGDDVEGAAGVVEEHRVRILNADRWPVLAGWLSRLPEEVVWRRPELLLGEAWLAYYRFNVPALTRIVERLDLLLGEGPARPAWTGELAMFKSFLCYWQGRAQEMLAHVATAREALPASHDLMRADSEIYFGLAHHMAGQMEMAAEALTQRIREQPERQGLMVTRRVITLGFIHLLAGRLRDGALYARQLGELARTTSPVYIRSWSTYLQGCCHFQSGDWEAAERCFRWLADNRYVAHTAAVISSLTGLGLTLHLLGRSGESAAAVRLLRDFAVETRDPGHLIAAESGHARTALMRGDAAALCPPAGAVSMATAFLFLEVPQVSHCRWLVARGSSDEVARAVATIEQLEEETAAIHNTFQLIDLKALKAAALDRLERRDDALEALHGALELAAPGGWVRPFVELGPAMADLLSALPAAARIGQIERLLEALAAAGAAAPAPGAGSPSPAQPLAESLTHRELDVLELLAERLYDKEIAVRLGVSISTVKTHLRHVYDKLAVGNRRQAVIEAGRLGLLGKG